MGQRRFTAAQTIGLIKEQEAVSSLHRGKVGVRRRRRRKRVRGSRTPVPRASRPGERWSLDFVSDTFGTSRKFRMLAMNDDCCRENLCLMPDTSISGACVARKLYALLRVYGERS
jgi:putative transposase